jgi:hypothetical protein
MVIVYNVSKFSIEWPVFGVFFNPVSQISLFRRMLRLNLGLS